MSGLERHSGLAFIPPPHPASTLLRKVSPGGGHPASRRTLAIFLYPVQEPSHTRGYHHPLQGSLAFFLPPSYANILQNCSQSYILSPKPLGRTLHQAVKWIACSGGEMPHQTALDPDEELRWGTRKDSSLQTWHSTLVEATGLTSPATNIADLWTQPV